MEKTQGICTKTLFRKEGGTRDDTPDCEPYAQPE